MAEKTQIGFVGIGNMGGPMVRNLTKADIPVLVYDLRPDVLDAVTADSNLVTSASSLAEVGEKCTTVITMLPTGTDVREAVLGDGGIASEMAPDSIIVDMSSSEPTGTVELAKDLEARGLHLIDAPVSGGVPGAVKGTLALMTGGPDDLVARIEKPLEAMGNIYRTGPVGSGHAAKALNNFLSAASLTAVSEALIVAQKFGLDGAKMADIWNASTGRSSATETKLRQHILNDKFAAGFTLKLLDKDVKIAKTLAESLDVRADYLDRVSGLLGEALEELGDEADHTTLFKHIKARAEEGRSE
ncbi:MAG: NAD(P)-dependent oxidoreductase [Hyphomicrobiaceae bacterium]|nr:NAD(P)-dependent oxidoreductase [Hyphomicrobiaceae bacterium]